MGKPELPSVEDLVDSVIRAGAELGLRIERGEAGRLVITADGAMRVEPPLIFSMTDQELLDYHVRLAGYAGKPGGSRTPWLSWLMLMSTHLEEAVYQAGKAEASTSIAIGATGFQPAPT
ncbi:hypothetical protein [Nocardia asteroides]|uniref:hypothetical protein n=1 Tax=Nocardia asteroides TaxID=1824 RepID=UPI001E365CE3|nr:hypothetical protein [Nocardia asteroides]UGT59921.1 hypothetical protein LTT61_22215 [Nocardia asteroides]